LKYLEYWMVCWQNFISILQCLPISYDIRRSAYQAFSGVSGYFLEIEKLLRLSLAFDYLDSQGRLGAVLAHLLKLFIMNLKIVFLD